MLVQVGTIRDQTRGELARAAVQIRTIQEAMINQQAKMSEAEEVITTNGSASAAADQRNTQDMVERMMRMLKEKEKRKKPDTDVELEDYTFLTNWPSLGGQHDARMGAGGRRSPRVQTGGECACGNSNTQMLVTSK